MLIPCTTMGNSPSYSDLMNPGMNSEQSQRLVDIHIPLEVVVFVVHNIAGALCIVQ
jgi:hypothetical protein